MTDQVVVIDKLNRTDFAGDVDRSMAYRQMYATDASIYRELPLAVAFPKNVRDLQLLVHFANETGTPLIPRGAGTSLAGQCVGNGLIVDMSRYMNQLIEFDEVKGIASVQPGLVRDELNRLVAQSDFFFGPNTSTSNRATIGGMVGNNSSGTTSVAFGVTRDKILEMEVVLSDGSVRNITPHAVNDAEETGILSEADDLVKKWRNDEEFMAEIRQNYPNPAIHRRNTGYALDLLLEKLKIGFLDWNKMICGSEGTLCFVSKIVLQLDKKPPSKALVLLPHYDSLDAALRSVPDILEQFRVFSLELMDDVILECARQAPSQTENMFFVKGGPKAMLMIELRGESYDDLIKQKDALWVELDKSVHKPYHISEVSMENMQRVWSLRSSGLGILSNIPGDASALACIEDTAVKPSDLADYIKSFEEIMESHQQRAVYYAHAGAGELHLRPVLNLKTEKGREDFRSICQQSANLVKSYNGSLSGEHGDGRVRAPFIKEFYGEKIYDAFVELKQVFDPNGIFNPGKIVQAEDLLANTRFDNPSHSNVGFFKNDPDPTLLHHSERCNGSGDCLKSHDLSPGMCPTYQATGLEIHSTRGRANIMRELLSVGGEITKDNIAPGGDQSLVEAMTSCLGCKACKSECPSGVDLTRLRSEFLKIKRGVGIKKIRDYFFSRPELPHQIENWLPFSSNLLNSKVAKPILRLFGISINRSLPKPERKSLYSRLKSKTNSSNSGRKTVTLALDEFVNYYDHKVGKACFDVLVLLGFNVEVIEYNSGRAALSKGYLEKAQTQALETIEVFKNALQSTDLIVGIEPSALLSIRDEYPVFPKVKNDNSFRSMQNKTFLFEEFILRELKNENPAISKLKLNDLAHFIFHGHCHQKALSDDSIIPQIFNSISGAICTTVKAGCCGMAGSFGYEAEHEKLSFQVAELGLFPEIRKNEKATIMASGMSCRHQIKDGLGREALHPAELILKLIVSKNLVSD